jgi:hypothetical protein
VASAAVPIPNHSDWEFDSAAVERVLADFMALVRIVGDHTGSVDYEVRVGIERKAPERMVIHTVDEWMMPTQTPSVPCHRQRGRGEEPSVDVRSLSMQLNRIGLVGLTERTPLDPVLPGGRVAPNAAKANRQRRSAVFGTRPISPQGTGGGAARRPLDSRTSAGDLTQSSKLVGVSIPRRRSGEAWPGTERRPGWNQRSGAAAVWCMIETARSADTPRLIRSQPI